MDNMLHLKWGYLGDNLIDSLKTLRNNNQFCDVTLVTQDTQISCHKVVLSACSGFFNRLLTQYSNSQVFHPFFYLHGISSQCINHLISFMYESEINISQHDLTELLTVAANLEIKGLSQTATPQFGKIYQLSQKHPCFK